MGPSPNTETSYLGEQEGAQGGGLQPQWSGVRPRPRHHLNRDDPSKANEPEAAEKQRGHQSHEVQ